MPWLSIIGFFYILWPLCILLSKIIGAKPSIAFNIAHFVTGTSLVLFYLQSKIFARVMTILTHSENIKMILYLAVSLSFGLFLLYDLSKEKDNQILKFGKVSNLIHRKLFHILGFALYTPMHANVMSDRKTFELLLLSQNLVTVLFIYIELLRFNN